MKTEKILLILALFIPGMTFLVTVPPVYGSFAGQMFSFTNVRGENVMLFGAGPYKYDSLFSATGFLAQDLVVLFLVIPLFIYYFIKYLKKVPGADMVLLGLFGFFMYAYASMSLGASYNSFFPTYVLIFSASLFSFIILFQEIYLPAHVIGSFPRKGPTIFLFLSGFITLFIWGYPLVESSLAGTYPKLLFHNTTLVTHVLDIGIIFPASFIGGILILKRKASGYKIAFPLLTLIILLIPIISLTTYLQLKNGIVLSRGEFAGPVSGFIILGIFAITILRKILLKIFSAEQNSYQQV